MVSIKLESLHLSRHQFGSVPFVELAQVSDVADAVERGGTVKRTAPNAK